MAPQPIEVLVVGKRELLSTWKVVAAKAGMLIEREGCEAGIKRGEIGLQVWVVASASFWQPDSDDEFGLLINTKEKFDDAKVIEAKRLVADFVAAFESDEVTAFEVRMDEHGKVVRQRLSRVS